MDQLVSEMFTDINIHYFKQVGSTNQVAHQLAEQGAPNGTTIIAEEQVEGRGRLGRKWFSPPLGGLWFSIILTPQNCSPAEMPRITLVTAAVIAGFLNNHFNLPVALKWPNDLLIYNKKICGILTEMNVVENKINFLIVGIGLNVNQDEHLFPAGLKGNATSMAAESSQTYERSSLFLSLREKLLDSYNRFFINGFQEFKAIWKKHNTTLGCLVTVKSSSKSITGLASDINDSGALLIIDKNNLVHEVNYGEITSLSIS